MITQTITGVVYSTVTPAQTVRYQSKPNAYISDLNTQKVQHAHTEALTQRISDKTDSGKAFADAAVAKIDSYDPPRGHNFDDWA